MKRNIYLLIIIYSFLNLSCKKFLNIEAPKNLAVTSKVFSSDEAAIAAMMNIYINMSNSSANSYYTSLFLGLAADEFKSFSTQGTAVTFYTNSYTQTDVPTLNFWRYGYNLIYQANAIYEGCSESTVLSPQIKTQLMGEALFIRAYWNFYLVNLYGDIPVAKTTDYEVNRLLKRLLVDEVYESIIKDLNDAIANLSESYLEGDTKTITTNPDRFRPNKSVATALLSRVYLYNKQYALAEVEASKILNNTSVYKLSPLNGAFLKKSTEVIWQLQLAAPNALTLNTYEAQNFILTAKPGSSLVRSFTLSDDLYMSFEPNDQRKIVWVGTFNESPTVPHRYPNKYKSKSTTVIEEGTTPFRVAEQFLIRAEARANLENIEGAKADLNAVRLRAGLGNTTAIDKASIISAIVKERRVELFSEYGHRWFDLKRLNLIDNTMVAYSPMKGSAWSNHKKYLPIPLVDIDNGPGLHQNSGYN